MLFQLYIDEMLKDRQSSEKMDERSDLFSRLVGANKLEDEQNRLTEAEVIGKRFLQMLSLLFTFHQAIFLSS
jgi:hypothetical protein